MLGSDRSASRVSGMLRSDRSASRVSGMLGSDRSASRYSIFLSLPVLKSVLEFFLRKIAPFSFVQKCAHFRTGVLR